MTGKPLPVAFRRGASRPRATNDAGVTARQRLRSQSRVIIILMDGVVGLFAERGPLGLIAPTCVVPIPDSL